MSYSVVAIPGSQGGTTVLLSDDEHVAVVLKPGDVGGPPIGDAYRVHAPNPNARGVVISPANTEPRSWPSYEANRIGEEISSIGSSFSNIFPIAVVLGIVVVAVLVVKR